MFDPIDINHLSAASVSHDRVDEMSITNYEASLLYVTVENKRQYFHEIGANLPDFARNESNSPYYLLILGNNKNLGRIPLIHGQTTPKAWLKMSRPKILICNNF